MTRLSMRIFYCLSCLLSVLTGGPAFMPLSARAHIHRLRIEAWIDFIFRIFGQFSHCRKSWEREICNSVAVLKIAEGRGDLDV